MFFTQGGLQPLEAELEDIHAIFAFLNSFHGHSRTFKDPAPPLEIADLDDEPIIVSSNQV